MSNNKHCGDCVHARYKVECKPFHIFCNLNNEFKNTNEHCNKFIESKVDSQVVEAFGQKLGMSEQEVIDQMDRIAKNLEEMKKNELMKPVEPLRRFVAITILQNGMNKAYVYDNEADYRLSDDVLTKWLEIGINVKNAFDECAKDCNSGSEHIQKFKDWLKQVNA